MSKEKSALLRASKEVLELTTKPPRSLDKVDRAWLRDWNKLDLPHMSDSETELLCYGHYVGWFAGRISIPEAK